MCGIVAYKGEKNCYPILINGLHKLEYRGYDSAGITSLDKNRFQTTKAAGKVKDLKHKIKSKSFSSKIGIAHTRWATHGEPNIKNAHPHIDFYKNIALVHNGIIENFESLKKFLKSKNISFKSDTDTEVLTSLIGYFFSKGNFSFEDAVRAALQRVEGAYGIVVINKNNKNQMIACRNGSPIVVGVKKDEFFIASDIAAIVPKTNNVIYLEDNQMIIIKDKSYQIKSIEKDIVLPKNIEKIDIKIESFEKGSFKHFMHKEIHEQSRTIYNTLRGRIRKNEIILSGLNKYWNKILKSKRIYITACGTSWHAALIGKRFIEQFAHIPVHVEYASEFRYSPSIIDSRTIVIAISQSGETADTIGALKKAKSVGALTIGICNVAGSTISRMTDCGVFTRCGYEIGVASTKAFTAQISVLYMFALKLADRKKLISKNELKGHIKDEFDLVFQIKKVLKLEKKIKKIALKYSKANDFLYLGRGLNFPIALEGALKLKEISYIHAEGYPAAEMKHGPIALIDKNMPSVFIVSKDKTYDKILSNIQEIKSRKGKIIIITDHNSKNLRDLSNDLILLPKTNSYIFLVLSTIVLQLFSYFIAVKKGCDVDQPRNLAKAVSVE